jgi:pyridoxal/pyridoxine/pyridoxamine kinase
MSFNEKLLTILKSDPRFVDQDGVFIKSEVIHITIKIIPFAFRLFPVYFKINDNSNINTQIARI